MLTPGSLGQVVVATPGTPVPLSGSLLLVNKVRIAGIIGNAGRSWLGLSTLNKSTGAGVLKEFWPTGGGGGVADAIEISSPGLGNHIDLSKFYADANTAGEGFSVSYWVSNVTVG